ncbi:winged helix-turn-helix domain-containing protein [Scandinavium sp.]|uniref:winged helix-turn-helix domain-containing protein n=1 Tax=Scandinavium sp. TaxID=2830653 RepID=UPI0028A1FB8A|nr:winged helix-turn-helix domain-containing protein [Scandinavium sp.]
MKKNSAGEGKIFFLDFTFNPALRTLQQNECVQQLRKKQSDVLALLCAKFPAPVSQEDFLKEVWGGGYVTSQSIAQMIRSLRLCLKDESKNIIVTIPKLGYQLAVEPTWEVQMHEKRGLVKPPSGNVELENISFASQQLIQLSPSCSTALAVIPRDIADERVNVKRVKQRKWFFSTVAAFCLSLISVAMSARSDPLSLINERSDSFSSQLQIPDKGVALSRVVYCCDVTSFRLCQQEADRFSGTCSLQLNQTLLN